MNKDMEKLRDLFQRELMFQRVKDNTLVCLLHKEPGYKFHLTKELIESLPLFELKYDFNKESVTVWLEEIKETKNVIKPIGEGPHVVIKGGET